MIPHRSEVRYSKNHNLLRSVGFVTVLAAVGATGLITDLLEFSDVKVDTENSFLTWYIKKELLIDEVRNTKRGGLVLVAPPCATWVFLSLGSHVWNQRLHVISALTPLVLTG